MFAAQQAHDGEAVFVRHGHVEQQRVVFVFLGEPDGFIAVGSGIHRVAFGGETEADVFGNFGFVFGEENAHE